MELLEPPPLEPPEIPLELFTFWLPTLDPTETLGPAGSAYESRACKVIERGSIIQLLVGLSSVPVQKSTDDDEDDEDDVVDIDDFN